MKRRSFKYYALIIVALLVINNLNFVANAFIKTTKIGFQIHIAYDETGATIFADASQVPENIVLKSLKDEQGNEYNPYEFKEYIKENGKYIYLLTYEDKNEQKEYSEEIVVVVKREFTLENKNESNNQEDTANKEDINDIETISVDKLEKLSTGQGNGYEIDAYASESSWSLGETLIFNGGYFSDDSTFVNSINDRTFDKAYVIRAGSTEKIEIRGLFMSTDKAGKINKYFVYEKGTDNDPVVGYKLNDNDKIQAYFKLKNETNYQNITINKLEGWDVSIIPADINKILVGANVVVTYTYPSHYKDDKIEIKANGNTINFKEESKNQGTRTISFTMPNTPVTIDITGTKQSVERKVGLKVDNSVYYQPYDTGYFSLWMEPKNYANTKIYRNFSNKTKFNENYTFGIVNARGSGALNATGLTTISRTYNDNFNGKFNVNGRIPSDEMVDGPVYTGSSETNNSQYGVHALASFEQGETLEFNFVGSRAKWKNSSTIDYRYVPNSSMELRIFKDSNDFEKAESEVVNIPLFQNKDAYDKQIKNGELIESEVEVNGKLITDNGFYPVSTKLANGMEIIVYQKNYSTANPGKLNTSAKAGKFNFIIKVKNAVDSFLLNTKFTPESQQVYQLNMNMDAFEKDNTNQPMIEAYDFKTAKNYIKVKDTDTVMIGNTTGEYYDFRMKIKPGYSYPYVYITDYYNNILTSNNKYNGPISNNSIDISKPSEKQLGRWWVNFKTGGSKLISDTIGQNGQNDGYYHVRIDAIFNYEHGAYPMHIKSEPIQFTYNFSDGNGGSLLNGNNINVKNNKYFSVPSRIPESTTGQKYFKGWKLQVKLSDGRTIEIKDKNNNYFLPSDLIDITYISEELAKAFGKEDIGKTAYALEFTPEFTSVSSESKFEIGKWERKYQTSYTDMSRDFGKEIQALKNEQLYVTYQSEIENPKESSIMYLGRYFLGVDSKVAGILQKEDDVIATFNYYKGLKVNYKTDTIQGVQAGLVTDDNWYISKNVQVSDAPPNTVNLSHEIQLKTPTISNNNLEFVGWQLVNSKGRPFTNVDIYKPNTTLDLTTITDTKIQNDIFDNGMINLKAVWKNKVKVVHEYGLISPTKEAYQVALEGEDLTLTAKFKYVNSDGSESNEGFDSIKDSLKYALLKKNSSSNKYEVLLTESKKNSNDVGSIEIEDGGNKLFTIKASIKKDYISTQTDNSSDYRIVAYTATNKGMDKIESSNLGGVNGILGSGDPDFNIHEVPIVSTNVYYGRINNIIKYPKEIAMFEKVDGTIDSDIEEIKLMSYPNNNQIQNLPNPNPEFEVKVEKDTVLMENVLNNRDTFEAKVLDENGNNIINFTLGNLKYTKTGSTIVSNVIKFKLKNEDKRTFKDGEKFTGKLKFIFNKLPVSVNP